jgi:hypothetical protein
LPIATILPFVAVFVGFALLALLCLAHPITAVGFVLWAVDNHLAIDTLLTQGGIRRRVAGALILPFAHALRINPLEHTARV